LGFYTILALIPTLEVVANATTCAVCRFDEGPSVMRTKDAQTSGARSFELRFLHPRIDPSAVGGSRRGAAAAREKELLDFLSEASCPEE